MAGGPPLAPACTISDNPELLHGNGLDPRALPPTIIPFLFGGLGCGLGAQRQLGWRSPVGLGGWASTRLAFLPRPCLPASAMAASRGKIVSQCLRAVASGRAYSSQAASPMTAAIAGVRDPTHAKRLAEALEKKVEHAKSADEASASELEVRLRVPGRSDWGWGVGNRAQQRAARGGRGVAPGGGGDSPRQAGGPCSRPLAERAHAWARLRVPRIPQPRPTPLWRWRSLPPPHTHTPTHAAPRPSASCSGCTTAACD